MEMTPAGIHDICVDSPSTTPEVDAGWTPGPRVSALPDPPAAASCADRLRDRLLGKYQGIRRSSRLLRWTWHICLTSSLVWMLGSLATSLPFVNSDPPDVSPQVVVSFVLIATTAGYRSFLWSLWLNNLKFAAEDGDKVSFDQIAQDKPTLFPWPRLP